MPEVPRPVAATTAGEVRGRSAEWGVVFHGIPFAAPPVGPRRNRPPVRPDRWDGIRDCVAVPPMSPQFQVPVDTTALSRMTAQGPMSEDCLYLNVWTPAVDDGRRPVMVWIHGGAFAAGSAVMPLSDDGSAFARDGVVLVSIAYRLGAFGFLYLDEHFDNAAGTGNLGILDQIAALEWVREHIAAFGGDPDQVTVFGQSAGGMSVATLMATPHADGLFRRGIAQSGAGHHNLGPAAAARVTARVLALLAVRPGDRAALEALPTHRILAATTQVAHLEAPGLLGDEADKLMAFLPVIDGTTRDRLPVDAIRDGAAGTVDLLVGSTADELDLVTFGAPSAVRDLVPEPDVAAFFRGTDRTADDVLEVYAGNRPDRSRRRLAVAVAADHLCTIPTLRLAEARAAHRDNVWLYRFDWGITIDDGVHVGACHGIELPFVFDRLAGARFLVGAGAPQELPSAMHGAWIRFATTGDPAGGAVGDWPRYDTDRRPVLTFDTKIQVRDDPAADERRLWDGVR